MNLHHALEHVLEAIGILVSGLLFYSYTYSWFPAARPENRWRRAALNGVAFGGIAVALMMAAIEVSPGVFVDARAVPIALIGLYEGGAPAALAAVIASGFRIWLGGSGVAAGVFVALAAALAATLCHEWTRRSGRVGPRHALGLSAVVFVLTVVGFSFLGRRGAGLFGQVWLDYVAVYLTGIGVLARLFYDVTEQHRLLREQQRFRASIEQASDAIRLLDADTLEILDVNHADCELSGYERDELIGRSARDFWPTDPALRARREEILATARAHGFDQSFAVPYRKRSGEIISVDASRRFAEYMGRRYEILIYRDASQRLAGEAARREAAELRSATLLARAAAHEINNPLAVIMGYLQLLQEQTPEGTKEAGWLGQMLGAAVRIRDSVVRLNRLIRIESSDSTDGGPAMLDSRKSTLAPAPPPPAPASSAASIAPPVPPSAPRP